MLERRLFLVSADGACVDTCRGARVVTCGVCELVLPVAHACDDARHGAWVSTPWCMGAGATRFDSCCRQALNQLSLTGPLGPLALCCDAAVCAATRCCLGSQQS